MVMEAPVTTGRVQMLECPPVPPASVPSSASICCVHVPVKLSDTLMVIFSSALVSAQTVATISDVFGGVNAAEVISTLLSGVPVNFAGLVLSIAVATSFYVGAAGLTVASIPTLMRLGNVSTP